MGWRWRLRRRVQVSGVQAAAGADSVQGVWRPERDALAYATPPDVCRLKLPPEQLNPDPA